MDTVTLDVTPRLLPPAVFQRLNRILHASGLGPDPHVFHLIHRLTRHGPNDAEPSDQRFDILDEAVDYELVTHDLDQYLEPTNIKITPKSRIASAS